MRQIDKIKDLRINNLPSEEELPVHLLAGIFKDKNQSYKLFWFKAILDFVCKDTLAIPYDDLLNSMIADAWYMVLEYHLNLGPADAIEIMIHELKLKYQLKPTEKKEKIIIFLSETSDKSIRDAKRKLVQNVPYRLQAPFLKEMDKGRWRDIEMISSLAKQNKRVLYYYEKLKDHSMQIRINERWVHYLKKNESILRGWIENELIQYLQKRNPNVPGIPFKISPPEKRDLKSAAQFWKAFITYREIEDVYTGEILNEKNSSRLGNIAIDHFIPWSYVTNDEMWNLTPTFSSINSSKSNYLPDRDLDITRFAMQHYSIFSVVNQNKEIMKLFQRLKKKHLNNTIAEAKLYKHNIDKQEFEKNICDLITPIYLSASNMGFEPWCRRNYEKDANRKLSLQS